MDATQNRCKKIRIQENEGLEGCRTGKTKDWRDAGKERRRTGGTQDRKDKGPEGCRTGGMCRPGGMQDFCLDEGDRRETD